MSFGFTPSQCTSLQAVMKKKLVKVGMTAHPLDPSDDIGIHDAFCGHNVEGMEKWQ